MFQISKSEIDDIFKCYQQRKCNEEISCITRTHGGVEGLAGKLRTSVDAGIKSSSIQSRRQHFDTNVRYREPMPSFWFYVKDAFNDGILQILCLCALVEIAVGLSPLSENPGKDALDGVGIVFAILVIVVTTAVTNYNKEKKFKQLSDENFRKFTVVAVRDGRKISISDEELLVGDKCKVHVGMIVPADGIVTQSSDLKVDESSLTGESTLMRKESVENCTKFNSESKKCPSPLLFSGTTVKAGEGWMLVLATGPNSASGKIREHVMQNKADAESNRTPLELKLAAIADDIGRFGLWAAVFTLCALLTKLFYAKYKQLLGKNLLLEEFITRQFHNGTFANTPPELVKNQTDYLLDGYAVFSGVLPEVFQSLVLCVTIIVVAIPEGLPLAVTLSLAFSVRKMMDDRNLVRHMPACETMGGADFICTDKTGTLTRNRMHVVSVFNNNAEVDVDDVDGEHKANYAHKFADKYYQHLRNALINNIDVEIDANNEVIMASSSKTDFAFYDLLKGFNENFSKKHKIIARIKFHSDRKRMSTIVEKDGKYFVYTKGAPEVVLKCCSSYLRPNGESLVALGKQDLAKFETVCAKYSERTLRNLAVAFKEVTPQEVDAFVSSKDAASHLTYEIERSNFSLVAIAAVNDALRPGVRSAVAKCHYAKVNVVMVTGDDLKIAEAIARSAGIMSPGAEHRSTTGEEFMAEIGGIVCSTCTMDTSRCVCPKTLGQAKLRYGEDKDEAFLSGKLKKERVHDMEAFRKLVRNLKVVARARAIDKYALVLGLRELDHVVAVTGDGTNDASALAKADVGFAMGRAGTDVARDAADIIILDDNFGSIVNAIKWGRNIFDNIRKFLQFQLSVNFAAVLLVFVSSCIGSESPITAIQMLWINLIMDSLGSLALSTEDPSDELLHRRPHSKREYIINSTMWKMIAGQSFVQFSLVLFLYLYAPMFIQEDDPERRNMILQLGNCFGNFPGGNSQFVNHKMRYYILDGKKSSWDALKHIRNNLDPTVCFFFDSRKFADGQINNLYEAYKWYNSNYGSTCHMTMIFNTFVFYSLFNQVNCRVINNNINIFHRVLKNWMFIAVTGVEIVIQILIVQYGGLVFKCAVGGLTASQWCWCVGLASTTFVVNFLLKFINLESVCDINWGQVCCCKKRNDENEHLLNDENSNSNNVELAVMNADNF